MIRGPLCRCAAVCALSLAASTAIGQAPGTRDQGGGADGPRSAAAPLAPATDRFASRLGALEPGSPRGYFELAEEVMDEERTAESRSLARHLLVLAYETHAALARAPSGPRQAPAPDDPTLAASVCLALGALAENEGERRWLGAMAETLGEGTRGAAFEPIAQKAAREEAALELATAIGLVRAGEGRRAAKLLDKPAVAALLEKNDRLLGVGGVPGGAGRIRALAAQWDFCSQCRNRKYVKGPEGVRLCPTCEGKPGPDLSAAELAAQLRLEAVLLQGGQRSWAAQSISDDGAVLRDLDPAELAQTYQVDPTRTLWRDGRWAAPGGPGPAAPEEGAEPHPEGGPRSPEEGA